MQQISPVPIAPGQQAERDMQNVFVHSARAAVVAIAALLVAKLFRLPNVYWAPLTALVITQSPSGTVLAASWQRFVGTALGAIVGAIAASSVGSEVVVFGACVSLLGLLCALVHLERSAYHFGAITIAIVLLVPQTTPAWQVAFHRFSEVSVGIGVALVLAIVWPEDEDAEQRPGTRIPFWTR